MKTTGTAKGTAEFWMDYHGLPFHGAGRYEFPAKQGADFVEISKAENVPLPKDFGKEVIGKPGPHPSVARYAYGQMWFGRFQTRHLPDWRTFCQEHEIVRAEVLAVKYRYHAYDPLRRFEVVRYCLAAFFNESGQQVFVRRSQGPYALNQVYDTWHFNLYPNGIEINVEWNTAIVY